MKIFDYLKLIRLNQPTGIWLLFIPCLVGIALACEIAQNNVTFNLAKFILLFFIGSILMRSAGCIINDLFDQDFDQKVLRTKNRPLASKKISRHQAMILLFILLALAFIVLCQFNFATIVSGFLALFLVITYPLMKRFFNVPQLYLGLTFNFGVIMASLALLNHISLVHLILYLALIFWTLIYDTIYAFQDIEDDLRIGVKSSAITINNLFSNPKKILHLLNFLIFFDLLVVGILSKFNYEFFVMILLALSFMTFELNSCNLKNPQQCLKFFKKNIVFGLLILIAIILA